MKSRILATQKKIKNKEISIQENYQIALKKLKAIKKLNASLTNVDFSHQNKKNSLLNGVIYSLKDNIATKGIRTTGGSKFLNNYIPQYNATVKKILDEHGAVLISKDNLDEFGLGGTGTFSAFGQVINPIDSKRITGGSSSGSAVLVQQGIVDFAIATDTGDSIRKPASFLGIYGYKPTYGLISRYGVYPYAPSIDHVGILANSLIDIAIVLNALVVKDKKDYSNISIGNNDFYQNLKSVKKLKIAIFNEAIEYMQKNEKKAFLDYIKQLDKIFHIEYINFGIELIKTIDPIYRAISYAEATSCYANLNGILFGSYQEGKNFEDISIKSRSHNFGQQLKRRFVIGAYATTSINFDDIYLKAKKIRTLIIKKINEIFKKYDAIFTPGTSSIAPLIKKISTNYCDDILQIANFAGLPSLTIPAITINNLPLGLNIFAPQKADQLVLNIAKTILEKKE